MGIFNLIIFLFLPLFAYAQFGSLLGAPQKGFSQAANAASNAATNTVKSGLDKFPESFRKVVDQQWDSFKKTYATVEEEVFRKNVFADNLAKIQNFNNASASGLLGFVQAINPLADLLPDEFNKLYNGFKAFLKPKKPGKPLEKLPDTIPDSVDWRNKGAISGVKNQNRGCSACYAFAAAGALEAHNYLKTEQLIELSAQNIIDCSQPYGNTGCDGGIMNGAFEYVQENKGVMADKSYPYETKTAQCRYKNTDSAASCQGWVDLPEGDEVQMAKALATKGPLVAAIDASKESFQFYSNGIYNDPKCGNKPENMNHGVLIVGYGQEPDGKKYWLVKNTYGPEWGIDGYVKMAKDNGNQCGIAIQASYPLV